MEQQYVIRNKGPFGSFILGKKGFVNCLTRDEIILFTKEQAIAVCEALTCEGNVRPLSNPIEKYVYSEYFS